jgi:hypothetical protein
MKKLLILILLVNTTTLHAQVAKNDVQSLLAAENYFSSLSIEKGIRKAFLSVSDDETIVFRPSPVSAKKFYKKSKNDSTYLSWSPSYARISKSGDWGFTSGPFIARPSKESLSATHGQYLSVWKKNKKGVWKLALDAGVSHPAPKGEPKLDFLTDTGEFFRQHSTIRQQQREDIVVSTDKLFSLSLKVLGIDAYNEFAHNDIHILFPGVPPVIGKKNAIAFFNSRKISMTSENMATDRAFGGEYAYTYGKASVTKSGKPQEFNYVRIWKRSDDHMWNVLFELFSPSGS